MYINDNSKFRAAMLEICEKATKEYGYNPGYFRRMISQHGGIGTAKKLLYGQMQSGLFTLYELNCIDLSMEALVLKNEFRDLFTQDELSEAHGRLLALDPEFFIKHPELKSML